MFAILYAVNRVGATTPEDIAAELAGQSEVVRDLLEAYPKLPDHWNEDFWADALLRGRPIPGTPWRSHDLRRPQPPRILPADLHCVSTPPPDDALVLFDGTDLSMWQGPVRQWAAVEGALIPAGRKSNRLGSIHQFGDAKVHLEFMTPIPVIGDWQYRGNSGVFLMGLYEIQILDSWDNPVYPDGQMAAVYGQYPPLVNASLPPGQWQCLDIEFKAPVFAGDEIASPARVSVFHNGIKVQDEVQLLGPTQFQSWRDYAPHPPRLPLTIQDHGDGSRVSFRNIWVRELPGEQ